MPREAQGRIEELSVKRSGKEQRMGCAPSDPLIIMKGFDASKQASLGKGFFSLLLAFLLLRGERSLTYSFEAWYEVKGLHFTYDQISGQP
ncbi:hypothetical protein Pint_21192 [Pistacia integerrima]|uniref:Uncharacterized protein n=1 Tax=Pistacia integerrima TaxID=434235 RepID=A0ACC0XBF7_9ROSI|nr:hypothetical protein Pint_21192 [Pistacia integerrima]